MKNKTVVLKDTRKIHIVKLPSFPGSEIELYESPLFGEVRQIEGLKDDLSKGIKTLILLIKDWNFVDDKGAKIPIEEESLDIFPAKDLSVLMEKVASLVKEDDSNQKKS